MRVLTLSILMILGCAASGVLVDRALSGSLASKSTGASVTGLSPLVVAKSLPPALTPTLGNYPDTSVPLSGNITVTPDTAPTNTTSINGSTSTNFKGKLEGDPT
ncbi:MAG: hypothetical protein M3R52_01505, partial [Acidobacteriota bacterium]|nr:hypothetical protein [Acidobacteriota bacterium]